MFVIEDESLQTLPLVVKIIFVLWIFILISEIFTGSRFAIVFTCLTPSGTKLKVMSNQNQNAENEKEQSGAQNSSQVGNPAGQRQNQEAQGSNANQETSGNYQGSEGGSSERDQNLQGTQGQKPDNASAGSTFEDPTFGQRNQGSSTSQSQTPGTQIGSGAQSQDPQAGSQSQQGSGAQSQNPQGSAQFTGDDRSGNLGSTSQSDRQSELDDEDEE